MPDAQPSNVQKDAKADNPMPAVTPDNPLPAAANLPVPVGETPPAKLKSIVDGIAYAGRKLGLPVVMTAVGTVGGLEAFAPAVLPLVHISHDFAMTLLAASSGYFGIPLVIPQIAPRPAKTTS